MDSAGKAAKERANDHLSRLVEDLGRVAEDIRHLVEDEEIQPKEGALRGALERVRNFVRRKPEEEKAAAPGGEETKPEEEKAAAPGGEETKPEEEKPGIAKEQLEHLMSGLTHVYNALGGALVDLKDVVEGKVLGKEGALLSALDKARQFVGERIHRPPERTAETLDLFDGSEETLGKWKLVGGGTVDHRDDRLVLKAGTEPGLFYYAADRFDDFKLTFRYRPTAEDADVTAAIRFLDPEQPVPDRDDPSILYPYDNQAFVAMHTGFEVQLGTQRPGSEPGTIAGSLMGGAEGAQSRNARAEVKQDDWNRVEIEVAGDEFTVLLNGAETAHFTNSDPFRGKRADAAKGAGFVGLLIRSGGADVASIRVEKRIPADRAEPAPEHEAEKELAE